jgi:foldase protein PrsA
MRKHMKTVILIVAILFGASMFAGLSYKGLTGYKQKKEGVATINGRQIDVMRLNQNLMRDANSYPGRKNPLIMSYVQLQAMSETVDFELMFQDAKKHFGASGGEIDGAIDQVIQANRFNSKKDLEEALKRVGIEFGKFKSLVGEDITVQKMIMKVKGAVTLSPDDLREVRAAHILVVPKASGSTVEANSKDIEKKADEAALSLAQQLLDRIKKGENFSDLAGQYSDDPGSKSKGGDLGYFGVGAMVPEFERSAFTLKPGEVSGVVKTPFGYHIIKLLDSRLRTVPPEMKGKDIKEVVLEEKKNNAVNQWLTSLKRTAKIEIISPVLRANNMKFMGMYDAAVAEYNMIIGETPNDPYVHLFLGDAYEKMGQVDLAIAELVRATSLNSSDPDLLIALGNVYDRAGKMKADKTGKYSGLAIEQYKKASTLAGETKDIHQELAEIYKNMGAYSLQKSEGDRIKQIELREKFESEIRKSLSTLEGGPK